MAMSLTIGIRCLGWILLGLLQWAMQFRIILLIINFSGQLVLVLFHLFWRSPAALLALVWVAWRRTVVTASRAWLMCRWHPKRRQAHAGNAARLEFAISVTAFFAFSYSTRKYGKIRSSGWWFGFRVLGSNKRPTTCRFFLKRNCCCCCPPSSLSTSVCTAGRKGSVRALL